LVETTYEDTSLTNGAAYAYAVTAVNAAGESAPSAAVTVTPAAPAGSVVMVGGIDVKVDVITTGAVTTITVAAGDKDIFLDAIATGSVDLSAYDTANVNFVVPAGWFKGVDQTITILTRNNPPLSVTTQQLWNASDKQRVITIKNGKLSFSNG